MERRDVLTFVRTMTLAAFGIAVTKRVDVFAAEPGTGTLTCNLGQWRWLVFQYKGKQVTVTMADVFAALEEYYGSTKATRVLGAEVKE